MQIEEREKIREKRSSLFSGRKMGRTILRKEILIGVFLAILLLAFMIPYFWNTAKDNTTLPQEQPKITPETTSENTISPTSLTPSPSIITSSPQNTIYNNSTSPADLVIGIMNVPLEKNGFEITVKSLSLNNIHTSVWIEAKNTGAIEEPFKLSPEPVIIDNSGNQYETIIVERSGISQSDLYPNAKREGAVFFERFKEGTKAQKLILYVNGDRFEFTLDDEKNT